MNCDISEMEECILMEEDPPKRVRYDCDESAVRDASQGNRHDVSEKAIASCERAVYDAQDVNSTACSENSSVLWCVGYGHCETSF